MPDQILVLVAEDEELVRFVVVEALHDAGFEVIEVEHAEFAMGLFRFMRPASMCCSPIFRCRASWTDLPSRIIPLNTGRRLHC